MVGLFLPCQLTIITIIKVNRKFNNMKESIIVTLLLLYVLFMGFYIGYTVSENAYKDRYISCISMYHEAHPDWNNRTLKSRCSNEESPTKLLFELLVR